MEFPAGDEPAGDGAADELPAPPEEISPSGLFGRPGAEPPETAPEETVFVRAGGPGFGSKTRGPASAAATANKSSSAILIPVFFIGLPFTADIPSCHGFKRIGLADQFDIVKSV